MLMVASPDSVAMEMIMRADVPVVKPGVIYRTISDLIFTSKLENWTRLKLFSVFGSATAQLPLCKIDWKVPKLLSPELLIADDCRPAGVKITPDGQVLEYTNGMGSVVRTIRQSPSHATTAEQPLKQLYGGLYFMNNHIVAITVDPHEYMHMGHREILIRLGGPHNETKFHSGAIDIGSIDNIPDLIRMCLTSPTDMFFSIENSNLASGLIGMLAGTPSLIPFLIARPLKLVVTTVPAWENPRFCAMSIPSHIILISSISPVALPRRAIGEKPVVYDYLDSLDSVRIFADGSDVWVYGADVPVPSAPMPISTMQATISGTNGMIGVRLGNIHLVVETTNPPLGISGHTTAGLDIAVVNQGSISECALMTKGGVYFIKTFPTVTFMKLFMTMMKLNDHRTVYMWVNLTTYELEMLIAAAAGTGWSGRIHAYGTLPNHITVPSGMVRPSVENWRLGIHGSRGLPYASTVIQRKNTPITITSVVRHIGAPIGYEEITTVSAKLIDPLVIKFQCCVKDGLQLGLPPSSLSRQPPTNTEAFLKVDLVQNQKGFGLVDVDAFIFIPKIPTDLAAGLVTIYTGTSGLDPKVLTDLPPQGNVKLRYEQVAELPENLKVYRDKVVAPLAIPIAESVAIGAIISAAHPLEAPHEHIKSFIAALYPNLLGLTENSFLYGHFFRPPLDDWVGYMAATTHIVTCGQMTDILVLARPLCTIFSSGVTHKEHRLGNTKNYRLFKQLVTMLDPIKFYAENFGDVVVVEEPPDMQLFDEPLYKVVKIHKWGYRQGAPLRFIFEDQPIFLFSVGESPLVITTKGKILTLDNTKPFLFIGNKLGYDKEGISCHFTHSPATGSCDITPDVLCVFEAPLDTLRYQIQVDKHFNTPGDLPLLTHPITLKISKARQALRWPKPKFLPLADALKMGEQHESVNFSVSAISPLEFNECLSDNISLILQYPDHPRKYRWYFNNIVYSRMLFIRGFMVVKYTKMTNTYKDNSYDATASTGGRLYISNNPHKIIPSTFSGTSIGTERTVTEVMFIQPPATAIWEFDGLLYSFSQQTLFAMLVCALKKTDFLKIVVEDVGLETVVLDMCMLIAPLFTNTHKRIHVVGKVEDIAPYGNPAGLQLFKLGNEVPPRIKLFDKPSKELSAIIQQGRSHLWVMANSKEPYNATFTTELNNGVTIGTLQGKTVTITEPLGNFGANFDEYLSALDVTVYNDPTSGIWFEELFDVFGGLDWFLEKIGDRLVYEMSTVEFQTVVMGASLPQFTDSTIVPAHFTREALQLPFDILLRMLDELSLETALVLKNVQAATGDVFEKRTLLLAEDPNKNKVIRIDGWSTFIRFPPTAHYGIPIEMDPDISNIIITPLGNGSVTMRCPESFEGIFSAIWFFEGLG